MKAIQGHFDGKVVVLDEPADFPANQSVTVVPNPPRVVGEMAGEGELDAWLDELSAGVPAAPSLPGDFSRADIYGDEHD